MDFHPDQPRISERDGYKFKSEVIFDSSSKNQYPTIRWTIIMPDIEAPIAIFIPLNIADHALTFLLKHTIDIAKAKKQLYFSAFLRKMKLPHNYHFIFL